MGVKYCSDMFQTPASISYNIAFVKCGKDLLCLSPLPTIMHPEKRSLNHKSQGFPVLVFYCLEDLFVPFYGIPVPACLQGARCPFREDKIV